MCQVFNSERSTPRSQRSLPGPPLPSSMEKDTLSQLRLKQKDTLSQLRLKQKDTFRQLRLKLKPPQSLPYALLYLEENSTYSSQHLRRG